MRAALGLACVALLLAAGCIPEARLQPTPEAQLLQGHRDAALATASGVELVADGAAWKGSPGNLERGLTPVLVRLENHGDRPLRLQYSDFALVGGESRFRYAALPPLSLGDDSRASLERGTGGSGSVHTSVHLGFSYGAWAYGRYGLYGGGPWGPYSSMYPGPYHMGPYFGSFYPYPYGYGYGYACEEPLPTKDMLQKALPEGTLQAGGHVQGFLYFPNVSRRERQVVLQARLFDADTGEALGTLDIPFQVREG
ncbi:hypothetical protein ACLESO_52235 [Pyxidicoccus sp. 3LG]